MEGKREKEEEAEEKKVMDNSSKQTETERVRKGKSCKGTLYFSSHLKSKGCNPRCVGITRSLQQGCKPTNFLRFLCFGVFSCFDF